MNKKYMAPTNVPKHLSEIKTCVRKKLAVASCFFKHKIALSLETLLLLRTPMIHLRETDRNTAQSVGKKLAIASCFSKHKMPLRLETLLLLGTPMIHLKGADRNTCCSQRVSKQLSENKALGKIGDSF